MKHNRPAVYVKSKDIVLVSTTLTHNTEVVINNPFRTNPSAIFVDGSMFPISWRMINATTIGVTATLPMPAGRLRLALTASQTGIVANTTTPVIWTTQRENTCAILTHSTSVDSSRIYCLRDGVINIEYQVVWATRTAVAGDWIGSWAGKNGVFAVANARRGYSRAAQGSTLNGTCAYCTFEVLAGDYLEINAIQNNSLAAAMDIQGNGGAEAYTSFSYQSLANTATTAATLLMLP